MAIRTLLPTSTSTSIRHSQARLTNSHTYRRFIETLPSIRRQGLNISEVACFSETIGWYGQVKTNRQLQVKCNYLNGTVNSYLRPIGGITIVVDTEQMKISEYVDRVVIPLPKAEGTDYRASTITPPFGPRFNAAPPKLPGQTGFKLNGNVIR
ncbi:hypothetical protein V6N11_009498 [Hibiscus sabdariffa]|uniref:Amine oxidase n=1 Tax=Hibiscus sabdariffa TaxID=183260 RepID=A0ABR2P5J0_9ROSI